MNQARLDIDWKTLGLSPTSTATDAETGDSIVAENGQIIVPI